MKSYILIAVLCVGVVAADYAIVEQPGDAQVFGWLPQGYIVSVDALSEGMIDYYSLDIIDPQLSMLDGVVEASVVFFDDADHQWLLWLLEQEGIAVVSVGDGGVSVVGAVEALLGLGKVQGVRAVVWEGFGVAPTNLFTAQTHGGHYSQNTWQLYGTGQRVAVSDTGLDNAGACTSIANCDSVNPSLHPDLFGRVRGIYDIAGCNAQSCSTTVADSDGHGTATAGRVAANGMMSGANPPTRNYQSSQAAMAPEAELYVQDVALDNGQNNIPNVPSFIPVQYDPPYQDGVKVHTLGYGSDGSTGLGAYSAVDSKIDEFAFDKQDYMFTLAATNNGQSGQTSTVSWPGTSKNGISVGAWDATFQNPSPGNQILPSSGTGPTLDGRVKPDVVATGGGITTRSSVGAYAPYNGDSNYNLFSFTSSATPAVAAAATLVREYLQTHESFVGPSAALVKAVLLNGAQNIGYGIPSNEAGWGKVSLQDSLPNNGKVLYVWDRTTGLTQGQQVEDTIDVNSGQSLRVTLVWTDKEADLLSTFNPTQTKLVNNLDLEVVDPNTNAVIGNAFFTGGPDTVNNVERVEFTAPQSGSYIIRVKGTSVPMGPQPFAVAITGDVVDTPPAFTTAPSDVTRTSLSFFVTSVPYVVSDPNVGDGPLTVSVVSKPSWLTVTPTLSSASLVGTPSGWGVYPVILQVCDRTNVCSQMSFDIIVNGQATLTHTAPTIGTTMTFTLSAPQFPNKPYIFAGAWSNSVGIPLPDGRLLPLNNDDLLALSLSGVYGLLNSPFGVLDSSGQATVSLTLPPGMPPLSLETGFLVQDGLEFPAITLTSVPITVQ